MATNEEILLKVKVEGKDAVVSLADLRAQVDQLQQARKKMLDEAGSISQMTQEERVQYEQMGQAVRSLNKEITEQTRVLQNEMQQEQQSEVTLNSLRQQLSNLKTEIGNTALTDPKLQEKIEQAKALTDEVGRMEQAYGVYGRNVGNYTNSITAALDKHDEKLGKLQKGMESMGKGTGAVINPLKNVTAGFKTLSATPAIAILGLLASVLQKIIGALKGSEENTNRMTAALAPLRAGTDAVTKIMQVLGNALAGVVEWLTGLLEKVGVLKEEMTERKAIAEEEIELQKKEREAITQNADDQLKASRLRNEATKRDQYSAQERIAMLEEAGELERGISKRNMDIAQMRYDITKRTNALTQSNAEALKKEAEAYAAVRQAEQAYYDSTRRIQSQLVTARQEDASAAKSAADANYQRRMKALQDEQAIAAERRKQKGVSDAEELYASQQAEKTRLDLQRKYGKVSAKEYDRQIRLLSEKWVTFTVEQANREADAIAAALDKAIELAGGKNLEGRLEDIRKQYDEAEKAIRDDATLTAEEKNYYLAELDKKRVEAVKAEKDKEGEAARKAAEAEKQAAADAAKARADQLEKDLIIAGHNARAQYEIRRAYIEKELAMENLAAEEKAKLEQQLAELRSEYAMARISAVQDYVTQTIDILGSLNTVIANLESGQTQRLKAEHTERKDSLKKQLDAGLINQKKYDKEVERLDAELAAKEAQIAREQAKREKALSIFQIAVNTAAAIMKIWAEVPKADFGVSTGILTALAAATGAAQIAAVASQPLPTARKGGLVQGATHEQGGVLINTEGDERIVAASPSRAFPELLNLISYIGKHAGMPDTGYAARSGSAAAGMSGVSAGSIDADALAGKIGERVAAALVNNPPVMVWSDYESEARLRARIEDSARQ